MSQCSGVEDGGWRSSSVRLHQRPTSLELSQILDSCLLWSSLPGTSFGFQVFWIYNSDCGHHNRPRYRFFSPVCLFVPYGLKTEAYKNQNWCERAPRQE